VSQDLSETGDAPLTSYRHKLPSTTMPGPVVKLAFGEAKHATAAAPSSERPRCVHGVAGTTDAMNPSPAALVISVS
jgi:hypothetical protein